MDADTSELEGKAYSCIEDCALCCLCQPELDLEELRTFREAGLEDALTNEHAQGRVTKEPTAIRLQENGACHFLRDRRCMIYEMRPRLCHQFPVHFHALRRLQLNANLSCPGISDGGDSLAAFGTRSLSGLPEGLADAQRAAALRRVGDFDGRCRDFGVHHGPGFLREVGLELISRMEKAQWTASILAWSNEEPDNSGMPLNDIVDCIMSAEPEEDLDTIAADGNYDQLDLKDPANLPVYVDDQMHWNVFRASEGRIEWMILHGDAPTEVKESYSISDIRLLDWTEDAVQVFREYARLLNSRDPFMGYAYQVCADQDYGFDLLTVYLGVMSTTMLDLWWRASLIGLMRGSKRVDAGLAREGIRAYDMDCLDMPTIGAFF